MKKLVKHWWFLPLWLSPLVPLSLITSCATTGEKTDQDDESNQIPQPPILPADPPPVNDLWLIAGSDNVNGLQVDRYANVIQQLQLSASDQMSQYSDQKLSDQLRNGTNLDQSYQIEIVAGDTSKGTLTLKLIRPKLAPEKINISNFYTESAVYHQYQSFTIDNEKWFKQLLPINISNNFATEIEAISSELWNQVLADGYVTIIDKSSLSTIKTVKWSDLKKAGYQFKIQAKINQSEIRLEMKTFMYGYIYQNQQWQINQDSLEPILQTGRLLVHIPTINDAQNVLIEQTSFDANYAKTVLPSVIVAQINAWSRQQYGHFFDDRLIVNPWVDRQNPFKQKYFKNQNLGFSFNDYEYQANDQSGELSVVVNLIIDGELSGKQKVIKIDKMLTNQALKTYLANQNDQWTMGGFLKTQAITNLKSDHDLKAKIDNFFATNGSQWSDLVLDPTRSQALIHEQLKKSIFSDSISSENNWNWLKRQFSDGQENLQLFGAQFGAEFNGNEPFLKPEANQYFYHNNLININQFLVGLANLRIDFNDLEVKIVKTTNQVLTLQFNQLKLTLLATGSADEIQSNLTISFSFDQSQWNNF